jgi:hypothetical protein
MKDIEMGCASDIDEGNVERHNSGLKIRQNKELIWVRILAE